MNKVEKKRQKEQYVVEEMIRLYCRKNHGKEGHASGGMCPECQKLADYAKQRSQKCPFMEQKTFCANCKVHCYKPEMREKAAAERFFERLFHNISQITIAEMKGKQIEISLGACFCEVSEEVSFDQLYRKADRAMYQSKKKQGYSASIYEEWMKSN